MDTYWIAAQVLLEAPMNHFDRAADIMSEASRKADSAVAQAKRQADQIAGQQ